MTGGAHRGPVGLQRQRRTIRFMQVLLVLLATGLLLFAGFSLGRKDGFEAGTRAGTVDAPRSPSAVQVVVLTMMGLTAFGGAFLLGGPGAVRVPTPARLEELAGRAEQAAIERAEEAATTPEAGAES